MRVRYAVLLGLLVSCTGGGGDDTAPVETDADADADSDADADADTDTDTDTDPSVDWVLPSANRVGQKLPMYALYPRPDGETNGYAYHRNAHPQVPYRVPIGVQGGEWPFRYELLSGPAGAGFVAETLTPVADTVTGATLYQRVDGYGVLEWTPVAGTHDFLVKVTDQGGDSVTFAWTVTTDEDAFVFVDSVGGSDTVLTDGKTRGTWDAPLQTFSAGLWKGDNTVAGYGQKIAVFREGSYEVYASTPDENARLSGTDKPLALVGFPGESVHFDMSKGHINGPGNPHDFAVVGIDFEGNRDVGNPRLIQFGSKTDRALFWENSFDNTSPGSVGTDNPTAIGFYDLWNGPGDPVFKHHDNTYLVDNRLEAGAKTQLVVSFNSVYVLWERNVADGVDIPASNGAYFLHPKDDTNHLTVRDNFMRGAAATHGIGVGNQINYPPAVDQEICWNTVIYEGNQNVDAAMGFAVNTAPNHAENTYSYRNSVVSERVAFSLTGDLPTVFEGNAYSWETSPCCTTVDGINGTNYDDSGAANAPLVAMDFDADGRLIGSARDTFAGVAGAEVVERP